VASCGGRRGSSGGGCGRVATRATGRPDRATGRRGAGHGHGSRHGHGAGHGSGPCRLDGPARPRQTPDVGRGYVRQLAHDTLQLRGAATNGIDRSHAPGSSRAGRSLGRGVAPLPRGKALGHRFEALACALVGIGHDQRRGTGGGEPTLEPLPVGQPRDGMPDDGRSELGATVPRQPLGRAVAMGEAGDLGSGKFQLIDVM
jgi:hypothetical protein